MTSKRLPKVDQVEHPPTKCFNVRAGGGWREEDACRLVQALKSGDVTVASLMGPLYGMIVDN